jgi:nucleotide-binding universal stress UspA family protein
MRKVLVAFDGSDSSKRALQYVIDFAHDHVKTLQVHLLNVQFEPTMYGEYVTGDMIDQMQQSLLKAATKTLDLAVDQLRAAGIEHHAHTALGNVAEQVALHVEQHNCDTVVMGTRGLGNFTGLLMGSVATRVVHEVSVPVLLVK